MKYLRFWAATLAFIVGTAVSFVLGGLWMWYGVLFAVIVGIVVDLFIAKSPDNSDPNYRHPWILESLMHLNVFLSALMLLAFVWACSSWDFLGIGAWVRDRFGYDALAARQANTGLDYAGAALSLGFVLAIETMVIGHELVSRTWDRLSMFTGQWAFALMFGTNFATEHVQGHHNNLGYPELDPVSVPRGQNYFYFTTIGTFHQWANGWKFEAKRLANKGKPLLSWDNAILRAWLRGAFIIAVVGYGGGWRALGFYLLAIIWAKMLLESLNYFSHYGIVRERGKQITVRHTFSDNSWMSNLLMYNLGRHGHHHTEPLPFYELKAYPDMPKTPYSYITMAAISMVPPLFYKVMVPKLKDWDEKYATPAERELTARQNAVSGIRSLASTNRTPSPASGVKHA